jgi:hypothetical protein
VTTKQTEARLAFTMQIAGRTEEERAQATADHQRLTRELREEQDRQTEAAIVAQYGSVEAYRVHVGLRAAEMGGNVIRATIENTPGLTP